MEETSVVQYRMAAEAAYKGYIETTLDALLIFEACQRGVCPRVTRRLHERERRQICSGSVYVFDEREAGIKRWTDGRVWSPSRILQNFLVYRELDKRAAPPNHGQENGSASYEEGSGHPGSATPSGMAGSASSHDGRPRSTSDNPGTPDGVSLDRNRERALVGSLTSSYRFRADGLVKKTISVSGLHMISYYRIEDVIEGRLRTPSSHPELNSLDISPGFLVNQNFRVTPQIEIGPDGRPRYRGEGEEGVSGAPGSLQTLPASASALTYAYTPGPFDKPSRPPSEDSGNSHGGSPASSHLALGRPSLPGMNMSDHSPPRPTYGRGLSSTGSSGPGRSSMSVSSQGVRYEPYGRPNTSSAPSVSYYPPGASNGTAPANNTSSFSGYSLGDHMSVAMPGQRGSALPSWTGRHASPNTAPYYVPSPPTSAADGRSFEFQQHQSLQAYPQYRASAPSSHYQYADDLSDNYRSASVPPIASQSDSATSEGTPTTSAAPPESRPSSATYHNMWLPEEATPPPPYVAAGAGRNFFHSSSRRPSSSTNGISAGPTRNQYDGNGPGGPLRGPSPYHQHYVAPVGGGSGSPAAAFRPASASSNSAYSGLHDNSRGASGAGCTNGRSVSSGSPLLSPLEGHQALPGQSIASPLVGSLPAMALHHREDGVGGTCLPIARLGGAQGVALPPPMPTAVTSAMGPPRKSLTSWQSFGTSWPPYKQDG